MSASVVHKVMVTRILLVVQKQEVMVYCNIQDYTPTGQGKV